MLKNLTAHRLRNQKTSLMYALSLSFTIMIISAYTMQLRASVLQELKNRGTYLRIGSSADNVPLDWDSVRAAINAHPEVVKDYSVASFPPTRMDNNEVSGTTMSDDSRIATITIGLYAVSPHVFRPLLSDFLRVHSRTDSALSLGEQLYTARGSQSFGTGYFPIETTHVKQSWDSTVVVDIDNPDVRKYHLLHPLWTLDQAPYFSMGDRASTWQDEHVAVSFPTYRRICGYHSATDIALEGVFI